MNNGRVPRLPTEKILRRSVLRGEIERLREEGKTVVFTNGCFDILHIGHIRYLRESRALGDCLVVGVNSDDSVRELKGEPRPLVPELERAEILAAMEFVDYVAIFTEQTADALILELKPQVYAKGGDYRPEQVPELPTVHSYGGRMQLVNVTQGRSTTSLIGKILDTHPRGSSGDAG
jgi:D-glycero-beta-D-manno-heptose 1-phosphate adenylyltransferase